MHREGVARGLHTVDGHLAEGAAERHVACGDAGRKLVFVDLDRYVAGLAAALHAAGLHREHRRGNVNAYCRKKFEGANGHDVAARGVGSRVGVGEREGECTAAVAEGVNLRLAHLRRGFVVCGVQDVFHLDILGLYVGEGGLRLLFLCLDGVALVLDLALDLVLALALELGNLLLGGLDGLLGIGELLLGLHAGLGGLGEVVGRVLGRGVALHLDAISGLRLGLHHGLFVSLVLGLLGLVLGLLGLV